MSRPGAGRYQGAASVTIRLSPGRKSLAFPGRVRLAGRMRIAAWDPADTDTAAACYEVYLAVHAADEPIEPPESAGVFRHFLGNFEANPGEVWVASAADGADGADGVAGVAGVDGYYRIGLPDLENLSRAWVIPAVHPAARRRGIGRELLRHAAARAAANERSVLDGVVIADSAGDEFARRVGATLSLEEVRRVQYLRKLTPERIAGLRAAAARAAAGYTLVTWTGPVPAEHCGQLAEVYNAFNDAPRIEGQEDEAWDADRIASRTGTVVRAGLMRGYSVAAISGDGGEMAAITEISIDPEHPEWAYQQLTAVTRPHRGHRLGLLVKTAMLEWLAAAEPQLEQIATGNAADNEHMIAVNETLGYEVAEPGYRFYDIPVSEVH
jgi:GNAT superfamily N-acetyltransferase